MGTPSLFSPDEIAGKAVPNTAPPAPPANSLFSPDEISNAGGNTNTNDQPDGLTWDMVKNNLKSVVNGTNENVNQIKDAAIGAGKSLAKGAAVIGDVATLGLSHLLPGSENASAGINAKGTALNPTNEDQRYGGYIGDAATFETGGGIASGIMDSLSHLPLAERLVQAAKALKVAQEHPELARIAAKSLQSAAEGGAGTLTATGSPKDAAIGAAVGGVATPVIEGAGKAVQAVRDIYRPLETAEAVQPVLQGAIKDVAAKAATDVGVEAPTSTSIRDVVSDLADNVKAKSQPVFEQLDELSNGKFSDAQAEAQRYRGSIDKAGKDAYAEAIQKQESIFDSVKDKMDPDALNTAKANWKKFNALQEVSDAVQKSTSGTRPEISAASQSAHPAETVNPKVLAAKLNALYNEGTLQTALGNDGAHALLDHVGASQQKLVAITDKLTAQKSQRRAINYVAKRAVIGAVGIPAAAEGLKIVGVLGGKK